MGLASGNAVTWKEISSLLDNDFIHGHIHGRSCMKIWFSPKASFSCRVLLFLASVCLSVCLCVNNKLVHCPCNNPWPVQARIIKFGSKVKNTLVKVHIVLTTSNPIDESVVLIRWFFINDVLLAKLGQLWPIQWFLSIIRETSDSIISRLGVYNYGMIFQKMIGFATYVSKFFF